MGSWQRFFKLVSDLVLVALVVHDLAPDLLALGN